MSTIFKTWQKSSLPGVSLEDHMRSQGTPESKTDALIYARARPLIPKILPKEGTCLPTANFLHSWADAAIFIRNFPSGLGLLFNKAIGIGGNPLVGLTSILYVGIALGWICDNNKQMMACKNIGDQEGAATARLQIAENYSLFWASLGFAVIRGFGTVEEFFKVLKDPLVLSAASVTAQTVASWFSTAFFLIYYAIYSWRLCQLLRGLSKGDELRQKILSNPNPLGALQAEVNICMYNQGQELNPHEPLRVSSPEELKEMALNEGVKWLEKLEKEAYEMPWKPTPESRKEHVRQLFLSDPQWMMAEMGYQDVFEEYDAEQIMIAFGKFIAAKKVYAKIENDLKRLLGPDAVEAANKNDSAAFVKALKSASWSKWGIRWKTVMKIAIAILGSSAILAATIFSGGLGLAIPLLIFGALGIVWIINSDGAVFKSQWNSGEIRKRDKFLVCFSLALSIAAFAGLATLMVATGGIPLYITGVAFAATWIVINGRAVYDMFYQRPWVYQKEPTVQAFRQFVETQPAEDKIKEILAKMSTFNREGLMKMHQKNWKKTARAWEKYIQDLQEENLATLMTGLRKASLKVDQNLVAI